MWTYGHSGLAGRQNYLLRATPGGVTVNRFEKTPNAHSELDVIAAVAAFLAVALLALASVLVLIY